MKGRFMRSTASFAAVALLALGAPLLAAGASGPTDADLVDDAASTGDVLTYGWVRRHNASAP
jgi:alcohol dehydrogenase (cytochrome c)